MTSDTSGRWLYRILSFDRVVQILRTNEWYFAHPSAWEDPYERRDSSVLSDRLRAQCWCRNGVSDAMWRIYSPDKLGVRIRVRASKLKDALKAATTEQGLRHRLQAVKYLNQLEELAYVSPPVEHEPESPGSFQAASDYLFRKRFAFAHEEETRVVVLAPPGTPAAKPIFVHMDAANLIESILVDPRAPKEFVDAYASLVRTEITPNFRVAKSRLYEEAQKREA